VYCFYDDTRAGRTFFVCGLDYARSNTIINHDESSGCCMILFGDCYHGRRGVGLMYVVSAVVVPVRNIENRMMMNRTGPWIYGIKSRYCDMSLGLVKQE
jgi:hypothetical protein